MATEVNVDYARIARAAIAHTNENGWRFNSHGVMLSLRSPLSSALIREINPKVANQDNRLSFKVVGGEPVPEVLIKMRPQREATGKATVRRNKATTISNANTEAGVLDVTVTYDQHREYSEKFTQAQMMKLEPSAEKYLQGLNSKSVSLSLGDQQGLTEMGQRILEKIDDAMFAPLNSLCTTRLITGVGRDLAHGTDNLTLSSIALFDADGRPKQALLQFLTDLRRGHNVKDKLIVAGGLNVSKYFDALKISGIQDLGFDAQKIMNELPIEFYFDNEIDAAYGAGRILIRDAGAAAMEFVPEHGDVIQAAKVANTTYRRMSVSMAGYDSPNFTLDMDLRSIEVDENAYPEIVIVPSIRAGIFTRPAGAIKAYGLWNDVTGIWGATCTMV